MISDRDNASSSQSFLWSIPRQVTFLTSKAISAASKFLPGSHWWSAPLRVANDVIKNTMGDIPYLLWNSEKFLTTDLYARSRETGIGVAYIGPEWACKLGWTPTITMFSGDKTFLRQMTEFPEGDPAIRESFNIIQQLTGVKTLVNMQGPDAVSERRKIKHYLVGTNALSVAYKETLELLKKCLVNWDPVISLQEQITYLSANIIGKCIIGIPHIPMKYIPLLMEAGQLVVSPKRPPKKVKKIADALKEMSDAVLSHPETITLHKYARETLNIENESDQEILHRLKEEVHAGTGVLVESNLSFLTVASFIFISQNESLVAQIRNEFDGFDWDQEDARIKLCSNELIENIYTELLRFITGGMARQISQPSHVFGKVPEDNDERPIYKIPGRNRLFGNSHLLIYGAAIHFDPRYFGDNVHEFDPTRFEGPEGKERKKHIISFSTGSRSCPAGSEKGPGFASTVTKCIFVYTTCNFDIRLNKLPKPLPLNTFNRKFETCYAQLTPRVAADQAMRYRSMR